MEFPTILILAILSLLLYFPINWWMNRSFSCEKSIKEELGKNELALVAVEIPSAFDTGPFPVIEFRISLVQTKFLGISGERTYYRIVKYCDKHGETREALVKIETTAFMKGKITWIPELEE